MYLELMLLIDSVSRDWVVDVWVVDVFLCTYNFSVKLL